MLHIVNKSPLEKSTLDTVLRLARSGALLLIEDAVYAATKGNAAEPRLRQAMAKLKVFALGPDLQARGVADRVIDGVQTVDYEGFVDLVAEHPTCQSWL
ncbi:sulfurtransferase complex subunit TusB [Betaproteobacteria bacterium PRO7]|jgi:tRNA 2-thiouridine synthesizing protein B|nr:sulfurtransferase complex subunit TusB [Burkholderiaceae bacterium]MDL1860658.1 sulfurtransferase complex subunit TusB [Betaproteobacteria bacterium PRO7]